MGKIQEMQNEIKCLEYERERIKHDMVHRIIAMADIDCKIIDLKVEINKEKMREREENGSKAD